MASPTVRAVALYLRGKKSYTVNTVDYKIKPGRTAMFGSEGYLTHSKGAVQASIEVNEVTPVAGSDIADLVVKLINQEDIEAAVIVGGKFHRQMFAMTDMGFKSATEKGETTGSLMLEGGIPKVVG